MAQHDHLRLQKVSHNFGAHSCDEGRNRIKRAEEPPKTNLERGCGIALVSVS